MCNCACLNGTVPTKVKSINKTYQFRKKSLFCVSCRAESRNEYQKIRRVCDLFNNEEAKFLAV